jgi:hypothetical protein
MWRGRGEAAMSNYQLLSKAGAKLQSLDILHSASQVNKFVFDFANENQEVIECLVDCIENHPGWLYGWLRSSEGSEHEYFIWLRYMILTNRPSMAVDHFSIFQETKFICSEDICETA